MGYIFSGIALLSGAVKGFCGKKISNQVQDFKSASFANMIRMLLCIVIGFFIILANKDLYHLNLDLKTIIITFLSGAGTAMFVVTWLLSVKKGIYMLVEISIMVGTIIPMLGSAYLFGEVIELNKWAGFITLVTAVILMVSCNNSYLKNKSTVSGYIVLILCGAFNGITDFSQKLFVENGKGIPISVFNFYTYLFSCVILFICFLFLKSDKTKSETNYKYIFIYIPIMAVCLFLNSYFKTEAAKHLDAAVLYPLIQGCALILSTVMSIVFFKEKINTKGILGICLAFAGLLIMNML